MLHVVAKGTKLCIKKSCLDGPEGIVGLLQQFCLILVTRLESDDGWDWTRPLYLSDDTAARFVCLACQLVF